MTIAPDFTLIETSPDRELGIRTYGPGRVELAEFLDGETDAGASIVVTSEALDAAANLAAPLDSPAGMLSIVYRSPGRHASEQDALAALTTLRKRLTEQEAQLVFAMRLRGASWQQIADATGLPNRQAAQDHYEKSAGLLDRLAATQGRSVAE